MENVVGIIRPSDGLRAAIYGVNALIPNINRTYTKRKLAQARNLLLEAEKLLQQGIANNTEPRC